MWPLTSSVRFEGWVPPEVFDHLEESVHMLLDACRVGYRVQEWLALADEKNIPGFFSVSWRSIEERQGAERF